MPVSSQAHSAKAFLKILLQSSRECCSPSPQSSRTARSITLFPRSDNLSICSSQLLLTKLLYEGLQNNIQSHCQHDSRNFITYFFTQNFEDYNYSSTMNKRPLEKLTHNGNYNQELFALARGVVQNCQQLNSKSEELSHDLKASLKDKQQQLENAIRNAINAFGKFVSISKAPLATVADHGLNIFEAITDNIETSVQRYKDAHKNNKNKEERAKDGKSAKQSQRPQDIYSFIKPAAFDFHNHEKNLQFIRTELNVIKSRSLDEQLTYVSTAAQLQEMVDELSKESEVAVDVEHSNKSYEGLTCLIQMSSRKKDYIIDVFPIWREVPLLKRIMENESIIKVMHGAEMDTKWLQRDFNIHIVNLFDTHRASRVLGFPKLSYAYLLNYYCNETTDKTYQLADWRQRPLSYEMLHYARLDTHYLLEIFDRLLSDLHQKALTMGLSPIEVITDVYASSYEVTKTEVELFDYRQKQFYLKLKKETKEKEFVLFQKIFNIMDKIARKEDIFFDQIVNHKMERQVISKVKEMLYLRTKDNIKIKVDKFLCIFKQSHLSAIFQQSLVEIKEEIEAFFNSYEQADETSNKKSKKNRIVHLQEYQPAPAEETAHKKPIYIKDFKQYSQKTYENLHINPFSMLVFEPIMSFLSKKAGLTEKQDTVQQMEAVAMEEQSAEESNNEIKAEEEGEKAEEGVIEFKRINPNVIYTIEEAEAVEQKHKPRKKRKEHEYEIKVKSKEANIFELLED